MAKKAQLRQTRAGTIINTTSSKQEEAVIKALRIVEEGISHQFGVKLEWTQRWMLKEIIEDLKSSYPDVDFCCLSSRSSLKPDGGILYAVARTGKLYPILITEKKNQGTNDARLAEGLTKQAKGNAIERLGKNVIGLKTAMTTEGIFPFVCFGDGCDFQDDSSILDRVVTIAMFGRLNKIYLTPLGPNGEFLRGSFYFREKHWTQDEMAKIKIEVAQRSLYFYFSKYGEAAFKA